MKQNKLKYLQRILIGFGTLFLFLVIPYAINCLILEDKLFDVVGKDETSRAWLGFWATYIGAIASFAMVLITWWTLRQNREQVDELKRQWEEQFEHKLYPVLVAHNNKYYIKIINASSSFISEIRVSISGSQDCSIYNNLDKLSNINNILFSIEPKGYKLFEISTQVVLFNGKKQSEENTKINITLLYNHKQ